MIRETAVACCVITRSLMFVLLSVLPRLQLHGPLESTLFLLCLSIVYIVSYSCQLMLYLFLVVFIYLISVVNSFGAIIFKLFNYNNVPPLMPLNSLHQELYFMFLWPFELNISYR
uniref:Uncharacterized protein n=1 Tax=Opuntia streptacantha TaxID=393608 RepID=A0A7C9AXB3_OPUST